MAFGLIAHHFAPRMVKGGDGGKLRFHDHRHPVVGHCRHVSPAPTANANGPAANGNAAFQYGDAVSPTAARRTNIGTSSRKLRSDEAILRCHSADCGAAKQYWNAIPQIAERFSTTRTPQINLRTPIHTVQKGSADSGMANQYWNVIPQIAER